MEQVTLDPTSEAFNAYFAQFAPLFGRADRQRRAAQYVHGLLTQHGERRNAENLAEAVAGAAPRAFQRLLTESPWDHGSVINALQGFLASLLNADDGVWVLEEIAFPKAGRCSVGVAKRNGAERPGGNCQIGVFLAYASSRGHALVDGRLYLPRSWADDERRRRAVGVPDAVSYQSTPDLGLAMLRTARARGHLRSQWVTGAGGYGADPAFRDALDRAGWLYMLQVPASIVVFTPPAEAKMPLFSLRRRGRPRMIACSPRRQTVEALATSTAPDGWQTQWVGADSHTAQCYQVTVQRVWECRAGECGPECWLVLRRNFDGGAVTTYLSNAPATTAPETLGRVSTVHCHLATEIEHQQAAIGLTEYEVRGWRGWYHHVALSLLAAAFPLQQARKS